MESAKEKQDVENYANGNGHANGNGLANGEEPMNGKRRGSRWSSISQGRAKDYEHQDPFGDSEEGDVQLATSFTSMKRSLLTCFQIQIFRVVVSTV